MNTEAAKTKACEYSNFKRARYFHGMLLSDRDFRDEQNYHREKRKLANKMLHGWGIVCGLGLEWEVGKITVTPGMALDCHGNEIMVCEPLKFDLDTLLCTLPDKPPDNPCLEVTAESKTYFITIGYDERLVDPVSVYAPGGGCDEKTCEHSRYQEGFCVQLESALPSSPKVHHIDPSLFKRLTAAAPDKKKEAVTGFMDKKDANHPNNGEFCHVPPPCPACCPAEHHLVLGTVTIAESAGKKTVTTATLSCRRYVLTPHLFEYLLLSMFGGVDGAPNFHAVITGLEEFFKAAKTATAAVADAKDNVNLFITNPITALCRIGKYYTGELKDLPSLQVAAKQADAPAPEIEMAAAEAPNGDKAKKAKSVGKK